MSVSSTSSTQPQIEEIPAQTSTKKKESRTKRPPSVREKEIRYQKFVTELMADFKLAIEEKNWDRLGDLIERYSHAGFAFHMLPWANYPEVKQMIKSSAISVLTAESPLDHLHLNLALDLLNMGADWNAKDRNGLSVLNIFRKEVDDYFVDFIMRDYPNFKHLFIDRDGRRIPAGY